MGVTTETLRITNEIIYRGKGEARALKRDVKDIETNVKKGNISFDKMALAVGAATAALGVAAVGVKQFYQTLQQGAQIQAAANTFEALAGSVGSTSEAMLGDLQQATRGTIDDLTLMQSASQFTAMGLAANSDEAARLAEIGSTLGAAFRGDAAAGMEEFALLLANQSIPRLDTFGISAGAVRTRIAELQDQFPGMTRETAFMQAVLEESEDTMAKLGGTSGNTAEQMAILETRFKNLGDSAKSDLAEGAIPVLIELNDLLDDISAEGSGGFDPVKFWEGFFIPAQTGMRALRNTIDEIEGITTGGDFLEFFFTGGPLVQGFRAFNDVMEDLEGAEILSTPPTGMVMMNDAMSETVRLVPDYDRSMNDLFNAHDQLEPAIRATEEAIEDTVIEIDRAAERQEILAKNTMLAQEAQRAFNASLGDYFVEISSAEEFTFDAAQELYNLVGAGDASAQTMSDLAVSLGIMTDAEAEAFLKTTILRGEIIKLSEAVLDGEISIEDATDAVGFLNDGLFLTAEEALAAAEAARILKLDLDSIPDTKRITVTLDDQTGGALVNQGGGGPSISEFATGTPSAPGGFATVGEFGPEFVSLPSGARVHSTNVTHNNRHSTTINANSRRGMQLMHQHLRRVSRPSTIRG